MENYGLKKSMKKFKMLSLIVFIFFTYENVGIAKRLILQKSNQLLVIKIAKEDVSSIEVVGERIQAIYGNEKFYTLTDDAKHGIVYLKPSNLVDKPFSIYLTTEQHHHIHLLLIPEEISGDDFQIVLPRESNISSFSSSGINREDEIVKLFKFMVFGNANHDYLIGDLKDFSSLKKKVFQELKPRKIYLGKKFFGCLYEIHKEFEKKKLLAWIQKSENQLIAIAMLPTESDGSVRLLTVQENLGK